MAGVLAEALETVLRADVDLGVAGRTDAGVHATGQVAHVDVDARALAAQARRRDGSPGEPFARLVVRLRGLLPPDVVVHAVREASPGFDARFSALGRRYAYRVTSAPGGPPPLRRADTLHHPRPLDVGAMRLAGEPLLGLHDFLAYCRPRAGATTVRELRALHWSSVVEGGHDVLTLEVGADAFCHSMVRSLVGALLAVGDGRRRPGWPGTLLEQAPRAGRGACAAPVAPARGLTLVAVDYPADEDLAARGDVTRARREVSATGRRTGDGAGTGGPRPPTGAPGADVG